MSIRIFNSEHRGRKMEIIQSPDLQRLIELERASWPEDLQATPGDLTERLGAFPEGIFILVLEGEDVAQVTISPKKMPKIQEINGFERMRNLRVDRDSKDLWVTNISVKKGSTYRGQGYGTLILTQVVGWAKEQGYERILAGVTLDGLDEALQKGDVASVKEYATKNINPALRVFQKAADASQCSHWNTGPIKDYWPADEGSLGYGDLIIIEL